MTVTTRIFPMVFSSDLPRSRDFYVRFLGLHVDFESDWFVSLESPTDHTKELGLRPVDDDVVPREYRSTLHGGMVAFVVDDVDAVHRDMLGADVTVLSDPTDLPQASADSWPSIPTGSSSTSAHRSPDRQSSTPGRSAFVVRGLLHAVAEAARPRRPGGTRPTGDAAGAADR